jgi:hypothetical protein
MGRNEPRPMGKGIDTMNYGAMTRADMNVMDEVLAQFSNQPIMFLEVGFHEGNTARGVWSKCKEQNTILNYWGIDSGAICIPKPPFHEARIVIGDSAEVFHQIPHEFDVALIDGCHCMNHVILDTIHYGLRLKPGGYLMFHDTSPEIQHSMRDPHGPNIAEFYNSVLEAHRIMSFPFKGWTLIHDRYEPGAVLGGMRVFRKPD